MLTAAEEYVCVCACVCVRVLTAAAEECVCRCLSQPQMDAAGVDHDAVGAAGVVCL